MKGGYVKFKDSFTEKNFLQCIGETEFKVEFCSIKRAKFKIDKYCRKGKLYFIYIPTLRRKVYFPSFFLEKCLVNNHPKTQVFL